MEPLILILAAGEGKRLRPITEEIPKGMVDIRGRKLIDIKIESLPPRIKKAVLIKESEKFIALEERLREEHNFDYDDILYQDPITSCSYLPRSLTFTTEALAYYLGHFPRVSKNSMYVREFDPVIFVPVDTIIKKFEYQALIEHHLREGADVTMLMKEWFNRGSNARIYTEKYGRLVKATGYINLMSLTKRGLAENERVYTHEGTYVVGSRFFEMPLWNILRKSYIRPDFSGLFGSLKFVPYITNAEWIDVRDINNLELAKQKFGK